MKNYIIIDLEATCDNDETSGFDRNEMEIIEIGAVLLNADLEPIGEFQTFIKPVTNPTLTKFCKELTSITQKEVDEAPGFKEAMQFLYDWFDKVDDVMWLSWGAFDKKQFIKDCELHGIEYKLPYHENAKVNFSKQLGVKKGYGMKRALARAGIELDGTHHRGIDDARNIAKLMPYCMGRKQIG